MRRVFLRLAPVARPLTPQALLETVRSDPGMTAGYYAKRYFGNENTARVNHMLWAELKRHGKVCVERDTAPDAIPRWMPVFDAPRRHGVRRHSAEDEDLSVLNEVMGGEDRAGAQASASSEMTATSSDVVGASEPSSSAEATPIEVESTVLRLVQSVPGKDIQFYVNEMPVEMQKGAPIAFRRLREAGLLEREMLPQGTYVWR